MPSSVPAPCSVPVDLRLLFESRFRGKSLTGGRGLHGVGFKKLSCWIGAFSTVVGLAALAVTLPGSLPGPLESQKRADSTTDDFCSAGPLVVRPDHFFLLGDAALVKLVDVFFLCGFFLFFGHLFLLESNFESKLTDGRAVIQQNSIHSTSKRDEAQSPLGLSSL